MDSVTQVPSGIDTTGIFFSIMQSEHSKSKELLEISENMWLCACRNKGLRTCREKEIHSVLQNSEKSFYIRPCPTT